MRQINASTGYEHFELQRKRILRAASWAMLVLIPAWVWLLISDSPLVSGTVIIASFTSILAIAWIFRPRCPFCERTLALTWKGLKVAKYCGECGTSYSSDVLNYRSKKESTKAVDAHEL
jgi:hypothetical protein